MNEVVSEADKTSLHAIFNSKGSLVSIMLPDKSFCHWIQPNWICIGPHFLSSSQLLSYYKIQPIFVVFFNVISNTLLQAVCPWNSVVSNYFLTVSIYILASGNMAWNWIKLFWWLNSDTVDMNPFCICLIIAGDNGFHMPTNVYTTYI